MNELKIAKNALEQIIGYYRRSHKHGENTCYMMCLEAERALREMSLLTQRAADETYCTCEYIFVSPSIVGDCPTCGKPFRR